MKAYKNNIWKMYLFGFLTDIFFISGVLVPFYTMWGKISFTQIMILQSFFVFCIFALEVPTGVVADKWGRKISLALGASAIVVATLVYSSYPGFYVFMLGEFLFAVGRALISGAEEAVVYDSLKHLKEESTSKKIFARMESISKIGLLISAPIGSYIGVALGLQYTMMFMSVPYFFAFITAIMLKEPEIQEQKESKRYLKTLVDGLKHFKEHKVLKLLAFDSISVSVLVFFLIWLYQPLLQSIGVPIIYFGFVHAGICAIQILFMNSFDKLEKVFHSKKNYLVMSAVIAGLGFALLSIVTNVALVIIILIIIAGFGFTRDVLFKSYFNKYIESHQRATVISTISMIRRFASGIIYPLLGLMVAVSLSYSFFILGVIIITLALVSRVEEGHLID